MKFIDSIEIFVRSGDGGPGMVSFRAARNMPKLGADGGNGGIGGDVILEADSNLNTLSSLRYHQWYRAENGGKGGTNNKTGKCGDPKIIKVPLGTIAIDAKSGEVFGELLKEGEQLIVAKGGKRGYGNLHYLSASHQSPRESSPGEPGIDVSLKLELKLLADVGLAGFPNAGKSTLLSRISAARPRIADYPFTTLTPNLGVVDLGEIGNYDQSYVVADVPGLIEGAAEGRGLGHEFLKHLERTKLIVYVVDAFDIEERSAFDTVTILRKELSNYSKRMFEQKAVILLNKIDLAQEDNALEEIKQSLTSFGLEILVASGVQGKGIKEFKIRLYELLNEDKKLLIEQEKKKEHEFLTSWASEHNTPHKPNSGNEND